MKKKTIVLILIFISIIFSYNTYAQISDTIVKNNSDSLNITNDTIIPGQKNSNSEPIKSIIYYEAQDSMMISIADGDVHLYGKGNLKNEGIELDADRIEIDMADNELYAHGVPDTATGKITGKPHFTDADQEFNAETMRYNFKTKEGIITEVKTQQEEGWLHADRAKIHANKEVHIINGKYTTCDLDHPHFYIALSKAKIIPQKQIVTGPFHFVIADVHLPVGLPFGFFPNNKKHSSGIIIPSYKDELERGFGLIGGGYYFAPSPYWDAEVLLDGFTKGSWGTQINANFKKRYVATGSMRFHYNHNVNGEKILVNSSISNTFQLMLNYAQDQKANPTSNFSANVNLIKGNHRQYNSTDINDFVNQTTSSSISYRKNFRGTSFNMTVNANATQNLTDSTINLQLPTINFNMNKFYFVPWLLRNSKKPPKKTWYDKIGLSKMGISFTSKFSNKLFVDDSVFFEAYKPHNQEIIQKELKNGFTYSIPLSTSLQIFKWINVTPSFNYQGRIYPNYLDKHFYGSTDSIITDTVSQFRHNYNYNFSIPFSTKIYGFFKINKGRFETIRHVLTPSIGYSYKPDFSEEFWGFYRPDPNNAVNESSYSIYQNGIYGAPPKGEQQSLNFSINNNFELKMKPKNDSIEEHKKVKLLDRLSISSSYNFAADSMNLNKFTIATGTRIYKNTSINFNSTIDPYAINKAGKRIKEYEWTQNKNLGRFTNARLTISSSISSQDFEKDNDGNKEESEYLTPYDYYNYYKVKWSFRANYSLNYKRKYDTELEDYKAEIRQNTTFGVNLNPTPKWSVAVTSGYDFDAMKITSTTFIITRDLHCWQMMLNITPFGKMKSYMFNISIKASVFDGVEYKRQKSWHDNF